MDIHLELAARAGEVVGVQLLPVELIRYLNIPGHERLAQLALIVVEPGPLGLERDGAVGVFNRARVGQVLHLGVLPVVAYLPGRGDAELDDGVGAAGPAAVVQPAVYDLLGPVRDGAEADRGAVRAARVLVLIGAAHDGYGEAARQQDKAQDYGQRGVKLVFHGCLPPFVWREL